MSEGLGARVGSTIGGCWRIDRLIGSGGMAAVYAATHTSGRRAAFKILHRELALDPEARERFLAERDFATRIAHPDRLDVFGLAQTDDGVPLLMMELLEGETLAALWKRQQRVPVRAALGIAERLLDFLVACHRSGIVHRDLKPENVFLTRDGRVKVLDFGVAHDRSRRNTARRLAIGTPSFMPPEQALGTRETIDGRSDVFGVGAILWSILSGHVLRIGRSPDDTLELARKDPARSLSLVAPDLPPAVVRLVDRALERDPELRWQDAAAMRDEVLRITALLDHDPLRESARPADGCRDERPTTPHVMRAFDSAGRPTLPDAPHSLPRRANGA